MGGTRKPLAPAGTIRTSIPNLKNAPKCRAYKRDGVTPCPNPAVRGRPYCRSHKGTVPAGVAHPNYKHGQRSRYQVLPGQLADAYEASRNDPQLLELTEHIALLDAKLKTLVRDMASVWQVVGGDQHDPRPDWLRLRDGWEDFMRASTSTERQMQAAKMGALINAGAQTDRLTAEFAVIVEALRKLIETQTRRDEKLGQFVPVEQVRALARSIAVTVKRHVSDPKIVGAIESDLREMFAYRPRPNAPTLMALTS